MISENTFDQACFEVNEYGRLLSGNRRFCQIGARLPAAEVVAGHVPLRQEPKSGIGGEGPGICILIISNLHFSHLRLFGDS